jgi:hypothetical protein
LSADLRQPISDILDPLFSNSYNTIIYVSYILIYYIVEWDTEKHSEIFSISSLVKISITWLFPICFWAWNFTIFCSILHNFLFSPLEDKSHIFAPPCNILYLSFQGGIFITYKKSKSAKSDSYKISTIVLAVCLAIVLAGILAYVVIQRKCNRRQASDNIPFYAEDQEA